MSRKRVTQWPDFVKAAVRSVKRKPYELERRNRPSESASGSNVPGFPVVNSFLGPSPDLCTVSELGWKSDEILSQVERQSDEFILTFDVDWPSFYRPVLARTANLHICYGERSCIYFEISELNSIPLVLIVLLKHPRVKLVGNNLKNDIIKFSTDFKFEPRPVLDNIKITDETCRFNRSCVHGWTWNPQKTEVPKNDEIIKHPTIPRVPPYIAFKGKIEYCTTFAECSAFSSDLLRFAADSPLILGFDLEWPFSKYGSGKTALMQICPSEKICYVFHVFYFVSLPQSLVRLLGHKNVRLTGLNITNDLRKLASDFNLSEIKDVLRNNMVELSTFANQRLNCCERWSLQRLCLHRLGYDLDKGPRISRWDDLNLTSAQLLYAATDAFASLLCYKSLAGNVV